MKSVLMIVYYFPPLGSVQVLRGFKFAKYLPEFGWKPVILAVKDIIHYYYDDDLLNELSGEVEIIRTGSLDPFRIMNKLGKNDSFTKVHSKALSSGSFIGFRDTFNYFNRWISLPDSRFGWYPFAVSKAREIIKNRNIDLIYSSSPPNISHLIGLKIQQETGLPWFADFKDLWSDYPHKHPTSWHRNKMLQWESKIVSNATRVITINPGITKDFQTRYTTLPIDKFQTIVHGYDPQEFQNIKKVPHQKFTIVHTGSFFEPRQTPYSFLNAVSEFITENPVSKEKIKVQFVGTLTERYRKIIHQLNLDSVVSYIGPVNRQQSIQYQVNADLLLLLVGTGKRSEYVMPAKTWEYLASGRTILCLAPEGVTADLIRKYNAGMVVSPDQIPKIKESIKRYYNLFYSNGIKEIDKSNFSVYDRRLLTKKLAGLFDESIVSSGNRQ